MGNEIIAKGIDELSITFGDDSHDVLSTSGPGLLKGIRTIKAGRGEPGFSDGCLYLHIDGDPSKFSVSEMSIGSTAVKAISFADFSGGRIRIGNDPGKGDGEVSVILLLSSDMPDSTMARAGITATEAITVAMQDLGLSYDKMYASGSARQTITVVRYGDADLYLRGAGKHCKMGELIGKTTIESVRASAEENGVSIVSRMSITGMMDSYGYDRDMLFSMSGLQDQSLFIVCMLDRDSDPVALATVSAVLHMYNEIQWGLVAEDVGTEAAIRVLESGLRINVERGELLDVLARAVARFLSGR